MQISDAEWVVMNTLWESSPLEASDVIEQVAADNGWSAATVKTMLHRLVRKGALRTESQGKKYAYSPAVNREDVVYKASRSFLKTVCGGDAGPALLHLIGMAKLSPEEVTELRTLLDQKTNSWEGPRK